MDDIDLTDKLRDRFGKRPRNVGRYNVSDLYSIRAGWITVESFFDPEPLEVEEMKRMWNGTITHNFIEGLLEREKCERKIVFDYKDIQLVGKADYLPDDKEVWDFKTSEKKLTRISPWNESQLKAYCSMFNRGVGKIYQPVIEKDRIVLKFVGEARRDDAWFKRELERLYNFHLKVITYQYEREHGNQTSLWQQK